MRGTAVRLCTPGHVMALRALLDRDPDPGEDRLRQTVDGNYCRCTGYVKIMDSAREAVSLDKARAQRAGSAAGPSRPDAGPLTAEVR